MSTPVTFQGRRTAIPLVTAATLGISLCLAPTAHADEAVPTICNGHADHITFPGPVTVPEGGSCELTDVTINGDLMVGQGGNLLLGGSTVNGSLEAGVNDRSQTATGYVNAWDSTVSGNVEEANLWGSWWAHSRVEGSFMSYTMGPSNHSISGDPSRTYIGDDTRIMGDLRLDNQMATIRTAGVKGETATNSSWLDANGLSTGSLISNSAWNHYSTLALGQSSVWGDTTLNVPWTGGEILLGSNSQARVGNSLHGRLTINAEYIRPRVEVVGNVVGGLARWHRTGHVGAKDWTVRGNAFNGGAAGVFARQPVTSTGEAVHARSYAQIKAMSARQMNQLVARRAGAERAAHAHGQVRMR